MHTVHRTFQVRGHDVHLQELADVVAVHSDRPSSSLASTNFAELSEAETVLPQVRAFENAGWIFVPRHKSANGLPVYVTSGGQVALGTKRLNVHIDGVQSSRDAECLLTRNGFRIVEKLTFAPNLFVVEPADGQDAIEAAKRLSDLGEVTFAEPEFIEVVDGRGDNR